MTDNEIRKKLISYGHRLEEHDFMIKSMKDLSCKIVHSLDRMVDRMEVVVQRQTDIIEVMTRRFHALDATIKMHQNTMKVELDRVDGRFMELEKMIRVRAAEAGLRFDALENRIDNLEGHFDTVEARLNDYDRRFDKVGQDMAEIEDSIKLILKCLPDPE